jgi:hypothetical protein
MRDLIQRIKQSAPDYPRLTREEKAAISAYLVQHESKPVRLSRLQQDPEYKRRYEARKRTIRLLKAALKYNEDLSDAQPDTLKQEEALMEPSDVVAMLRGTWAKYNLRLGERQARHVLVREGESLGRATEKRGKRKFSAFRPLKQQALERLLAVKRKYIDPLPLSDATLAEVKEMLQRTDRQLANLTARMEQRAWRNTEEIQSEASSLGYTLLRLSYYGIDSVKPALSQELRAIGRDLHLIETAQLYMDGGQSVRAILARVNAAAARLHALVETLP